MVIEAEIKRKKRSPNLGGARPNAGRKPMFDDHPETFQKLVTLPSEFWSELQEAYSDHHGRSWASAGLYDLVRKWQLEKENQ